MPNTIMSCNVGTKLFTFMTVFIIAVMVLLKQTYVIANDMLAKTGIQK